MSEEIRFERRGHVGIVVLDRPKALNALTAGMVRALSSTLCAWREDPDIAMVLVKAVPGRAFCAGGDIARIVTQVREHGVADALPFFRDEYRLNWRIKTFPKPYVALIDGITMGGGVGISVHGRYRIATERTRFAMPEAAIGFFPDVGGSYFLPRLDHRLGRYLAMTGRSLNGADTASAGVATHYVGSERLQEFEDDLVHGNRSADEVLKVLSVPADRGDFVQLETDTGQLFDGRTIFDVRDNLQRAGTAFALACHEAIAERAPLGLRVAFAQLDRGAALSFEDCMRMEYRMVSRALAWPDFAEGVRALIVDKDRNPKWQHEMLDEVTDHDVEEVFAGIAGEELDFDWYAG